MRGKCALCLNDSDLQKSHYMPKSIFRIVSKGRIPHENAPVLVDLPSKTALYTNKQPQLHLLCSNCENLFSENGENIVLPLCAHSDEKFSLLSTMKAGRPTSTNKNKIIYDGPNLPPNLNASAFQYFAASVFWRGSVAK